MADTQWTGFMDKVSGEEKLLDPGIYEVEVTGARPHVSGGEVKRGFFVDLLVKSGVAKDQPVSVYIGVPEPGDRRQGFWFAKKMAGFGDLDAVFNSMPDDLLGGLEVLCAFVQGQTVLAHIQPGQGDYSNRNALGETTPVKSTTAEPTPEPAEEKPTESTGDDDEITPDNEPEF